MAIHGDYAEAAYIQEQLGKEAVKMIKWQISQPSLSHFLYYSHLPLFPAEFCSYGLASAITIDKCSHLSWQIYIAAAL